jgi:hypothetical protein
MKATTFLAAVLTLLLFNGVAYAKDETLYLKCDYTGGIEKGVITYIKIQISVDKISMWSDYSSTQGSYIDKCDSAICVITYNNGEMVRTFEQAGIGVSKTVISRVSGVVTDWYMEKEETRFHFIGVGQCVKDHDRTTIQLKF